MITFRKAEQKDVPELSAFASAIVKEHYDPIIGSQQNDYMINMFQSPSAISSHLLDGQRYYIMQKDGQNAGFTAFYPKGRKMYIAKLYVHKNFRGQQIAKNTLAFIESQAAEEGLSAVFLNVNKYNFGSISAYEKMGFAKIRDEKNPIGNGYFMDDYVMEKKI